jgi:Reverse transcriptase (RNA-dependent DNA polymerase)
MGMIGVNDGIPQGSPVSPIMFLIFIQHVIGTLEHRNEIITFNYADDLAMVTESSYARTNSIRLQLALKRLLLLLLLLFFNKCM